MLPLSACGFDLSHTPWFFLSLLIPWAPTPPYSITLLLNSLRKLKNSDNHLHRLPIPHLPTHTHKPCPLIYHYLCFSRWGPWTSCSTITQKSVRNAKSRAPSQNKWIKNSGSEVSIWVSTCPPVILPVGRVEDHLCRWIIHALSKIYFPLGVLSLSFTQRHHSRNSLQHYPSFLLKLIVPIDIQTWYSPILKSINQKTSLDPTPPPTTDPLCSSLWNKTWKNGLSSLLPTPRLSLSYPTHDSIKTVPVGSNSDCHIAKCSGQLWRTILLDLSVAFDTTVHLLHPYPPHLVFPLPHWFLFSLFALLLPVYCLPIQVLCLDSLPWRLPDYSLPVVTPKYIPLPKHLSACTTLPFWCLIDYSFPTFTKLHSFYFVSCELASLSLPYLCSFLGYTFRRVILDALLTVYIQPLRKSYWLYLKA